MTEKGLTKKDLEQTFKGFEKRQDEKMKALEKRVVDQFHIISEGLVDQIKLLAEGHVGIIERLELMERENERQHQETRSLCQRKSSCMSKGNSTTGPQDHDLFFPGGLAR